MYHCIVTWSLITGHLAQFFWFWAFFLVWFFQRFYYFSLGVSLVFETHASGFWDLVGQKSLRLVNNTPPPSLFPRWPPQIFKHRMSPIRHLFPKIRSEALQGSWAWGPPIGHVAATSLEDHEVWHAGRCQEVPNPITIRFRRSSENSSPVFFWSDKFAVQKGHKFSKSLIVEV